MTVTATTRDNGMPRPTSNASTNSKLSTLSGIPSFQKINDTTETRSVAKYDGTKITAMGGQFDRGVMNMAWFNGKLYVGGIFKENGDDECLNTAVWDGKAWSEVRVRKSTGTRATR